MESIMSNENAPTSELQVPVLIAVRVNGRLMKVRDRGPLWIVYDVDKRPDLKNIHTERKMVWQLKDLTIR